MSLLERRRALMSQSREKYVFVEYIESTGKEWINTGFIANQNTRVIIDYQLTTVTTTTIFGSRKDGTKEFMLTVTTSGYTEPTLISIYDNQRKTLTKGDTVRRIVDMNKNLTYINSELIAQSTEKSFTSHYELGLFACNNNGNGMYPSLTKIYSCKIYDNDILVRDFVPCYRKADRVAGLYDTVSGTFFENQGTGNFLIGGEI